MHRRSFLKLGSALSFAGSAASLSFASRAATTFPSQTIRILLGFTAGGVTDIVVRTLADSATRIFGQSVVIENRPGAGGVLPANLLQTASPDGHTVGIIPHSVFRLPYISDVQYDPAEDLEYILRLTGYTWGLAVSSDSPIKTFEDYVAYARANPGKLSYGVVGSLTTPHLAMEKISRAMNIQLNQVPYKGVAETIPAVLGGHVMSLADASSWVPHVKAGKLRLLVVWTERRVPSFPDVPTLREVGIDMVETSPWGLAAPKGTPSAVIQKLHDGFRQAMQQKPFREALVNYDMEEQYMDSSTYRQFARESIQKENAILASLDVPRGGKK